MQQEITEKFKKEFIKRTEEMIPLVHQKINKYTIQLLSKGGKYGYKPLGTSIFVFLNNTYLLFTASHVAEYAANNNVYVLVEGNMIPITGILYRTEYKAAKNNLDYGHIWINILIAKLLLLSYEFIDVSRIWHSHELIPWDRNYLIVGYPEWAINHDKMRKTTSPYSVSLWTYMSKPIVYKYYDINQDENFVVELWQRERIIRNGKKEKVGDYHGISGCGLWYLFPKLDPPSFEFDYFLIGLVVGFKKGRFHVCIANKVDFILNDLVVMHGFKFLKGRAGILFEPPLDKS
ncbi:MAG: hypothetical protein ABI921_03900 [Panacibacter sp.]